MSGFPDRSKGLH